jgi:F-type H+-transporting ATPase subunit a
MEHPILFLDVLTGMLGFHIPPHVTYTWLLIGGLEEFMVDITGEEGRSFYPFIATLFIFILLCNLLGLIPGFLSPTSNINTPLAMALCVFVFTHYLGVKYHGFKYIKHFTGPLPALAPLFLPIELIGHSARVLSLTLRLFGNIMGEDLVLAILLLLAGKFLAPLPMMFLAVFTSTVQAFIFALLSMMYFAASMEHAH